jgi:hypothetical protein
MLRHVPLFIHRRETHDRKLRLIEDAHFNPVVSDMVIVNNPGAGRVRRLATGFENYPTSCRHRVPRRTVADSWTCFVFSRPHM